MPGRQGDRADQFLGLHGADLPELLAEQLVQRRVSGAVGDEVGPHRKEHDDAPIPHRPGVGEHVQEGQPLLLIADLREDFLELVHEQHKALVLAGAQDRLGALMQHADLVGMRLEVIR